MSQTTEQLPQSEIEAQGSAAVGERRIGEFEGFSIGGGAGVVSNQRVGVIGP